jgi:hypothetical protein
MLGFGLLPRSGQRVTVRPVEAQTARRLLYESLFANEQGAVGEIAESEYPEASNGRKPRSYGLIGGYARAWVVSVGAMALIFAVFLFLRSI